MSSVASSHSRATTGGGSGGSGGSGGGSGTGGGFPTFPTIPSVIKASDWITNKQIKVPILEDGCNTAEFTSWKVKFERYLKFSKVLEVWECKFEDRPDLSDGFSTQFDVDQWLELDELVGQLLFESVKKNKISDGYVSQTVNDPWRKTWSSIYQYYVPTGNNAMALQSSRVGSLWRREDETCRIFIKRLDTENALLKSLGGVKEDYVLNNVLLGSADPEYKPLVIIGIENKESYETVRDMLLRAMPHPARVGGKKDKQVRAMATIANGNSNQNQSGGKKISKPKIQSKV